MWRTVGREAEAEDVGAASRLRFSALQSIDLSQRFPKDEARSLAIPVVLIKALPQISLPTTQRTFLMKMFYIVPVFNSTGTTFLFSFWHFVCNRNFSHYSSYTVTLGTFNLLCAVQRFNRFCLFLLRNRFARVLLQCLLGI